MRKPRDPRILIVLGTLVPALAAIAIASDPALRSALFDRPALAALVLVFWLGLPLGMFFLALRDLWGWCSSRIPGWLGAAVYLLLMSACVWAAGQVFEVISLNFGGHSWFGMLPFVVWTVFAAVSWPLFQAVIGRRSVPSSLPGRSFMQLLCAGFCAGIVCLLSCGLHDYTEACLRRVSECRGYEEAEAARLWRDELREPSLDAGLRTCGKKLYRFGLAGREELRRRRTTEFMQRRTTR